VPPAGRLLSNGGKFLGSSKAATRTNKAQTATQQPQKSAITVQNQRFHRQQSENNKGVYTLSHTGRKLSPA